MLCRFIVPVIPLSRAIVHDPALRASKSRTITGAPSKHEYGVASKDARGYTTRITPNGSR
jgi:hypothetical protein